MTRTHQARRAGRRTLVPSSWLLGLASSLPLVVGVAGCDGEKKKDAPDFAKAFDNTAKTDTKVTEDGMKALREKAEKEAAEAREAELQKITELPQPLPADVATACQEAGAALDEFKQQRLASDATELERWNRTKEPDLRKFVENCTATGSVEFGACLTSAHQNASMAMFGPGATDDFAERCTRRYGGGEAKAAAP
ncbi:hypothetical protein [Paraliomyxa miuraensis]|uniref:hypothetical protein n=1 Tax=Paraliomyxa miuraensis TaxID=376150 RepID=UPI0022568732|nr:hypothetical protein [Paraliomyxa miuraensis]MCX4242176.1 hypothetical protein [Paraliomyxa miuraensis]